MKKSRRQSFCHTHSFWLFVLPSLALFAVFFLVPLVLSIWFSFTNYDGWKTMDVIGLKNYTDILKDGDFYKTVGRTLLYTVCNLPFKIAIPLLLAALVTSRLVKGKTLMRTLIYIPVLLSALVAGITINWMFGQEYGLINFILQKMGIDPLQWSLNPILATVVISVASNWISAGYYMLLYVGGINNINRELYEAASVDQCRRCKEDPGIYQYHTSPSDAHYFYRTPSFYRISFKGIRAGTGYFSWRTRLLDYIYGTVHF